MTAEIVVFTKANGPLTKRIGLNADGTINSDGSACTMAHGRARRVKLADVAELAAHIAELKSNQAIALGALRDDLPDEVAIVAMDKLNGTGAIARTAENLHFRRGQPAFALLDFDQKGMPAAVAERLAELGGFWPALVSVIPALADVARVTRLSTSAGLTNADTGEAYPGSGGLHEYVMVPDGTDIPRFLKTLHARCWLAGLGWMVIGGGGQLLERSIVDRMVGAPERLVFEGPPVLVKPLVQDATSRKPTVIMGGHYA
jgi:hypothetical protein